MQTSIISASRRTDIPAYYSEWFMNRIREGTVTWNNPYNGKPCSTSLLPEDVAAFVFLSKNYLPFMQHLDELDRLGYRSIFYYTITGLPKEFEPNVPDPEDTIPAAQELARRYTPDAVLWRYDPIVISDITPAEYHIKRFSELADKLEGSTRRCYFSFTYFYKKVTRNLGDLQAKKRILCTDPSHDQKIELANRLADIANDHGMQIYSCCGDDLVQGSIQKAKCIDADLLLKLYPDRMRAFKPNKTRKECGCYESKDIGAYDTCPHGCVYCYANSNKTVVERRWKEHKVDGISLVTSPLLGREGAGEVLLRQQAIARSKLDR